MPNSNAVRPRAVAWNPRQSGMLRGFATVTFPSGAVFHECAVFEQARKWWAAPPSKPMVGRDGMVLKDDGGKVRYSPVVTFTDKAARDRWSAAVITAVHDAHPELLEAAAAEPAETLS